MGWDRSPTLSPQGRRAREGGKRKCRPSEIGKTEKRCLKATLRIRPRDCVTKQSYETRFDPTSDLLAKILSQNGNGPPHTPPMVFRYRASYRATAPPRMVHSNEHFMASHTYLPGGRPEGRPGLSGAREERMEAESTRRNSEEEGGKAARGTPPEPRRALEEPREPRGWKELDLDPWTQETARGAKKRNHARREGKPREIGARRESRQTRGRGARRERSTRDRGTA